MPKPQITDVMYERLSLSKPESPETLGADAKELGLTRAWLSMELDAAEVNDAEDRLHAGGGPLADYLAGAVRAALLSAGIEAPSPDALRRFAASSH
jgi:hypothetical protein